MNLEIKEPKKYIINLSTTEKTTLTISDVIANIDTPHPCILLSSVDDIILDKETVLSNWRSRGKFNIELGIMINGNSPLSPIRVSGMVEYRGKHCIITAESSKIRSIIISVGV